MVSSVVCVDDDPDVLLLLQLTAAHEADFEVVATAPNADHLRELVDELHPDVVVLDHGLDARRWGLEFVEVVRDSSPLTTIALFTARQGLATAARNAGVDVLVEKPHVDELWALVRSAREAQSVIDVRDGAVRKFFCNEGARLR